MVAAHGMLHISEKFSKKIWMRLTILVKLIILHYIYNIYTNKNENI